MTKTQWSYEIVDRWQNYRNDDWAGPAVAARFEAGVKGENYLEIVRYTYDFSYNPVALEIMSVLERTGLKDAVLLDYGCGNAAYRRMLAHFEFTKDWQYWGADVNSSIISSCRERFPDCRFELVVEDSPLPFASGEVDIVLVSGLIESIESPVALLSALARVSKEWLLLCRVPVRSNKASTLFHQTVTHAWGREEHTLCIYRKIDFDKLVAESGLEIVHCAPSEASGNWTMPDDPELVQAHTYLLRKVGQA